MKGGRSLPVSRRLALRALIGLVGTPGALLVAGCTKDKASREGDVASSPTTNAILKAGLVTDVGGVNDKSFNTAAWEGLQRAGKELGLRADQDYKYTESKQGADYARNLSRYAQNSYDLVFAVGFLMQDALAEVAGRFPDVKFAIVDGDAPALSNCVALKFREEEGSFLAGALAGAMTKSKIVGFVGGMELPLIKKFEAGFKAGVRTTNSGARVVVGYANKFDDPQKGQELALSQMGAGADILFHAAGSTGIGVIKAVERRGPGFWAIGVDKDQDDLAPGRVLTSMVKRVDTVVFDTCKQVAEKRFEPGTKVFGLKEGGVGLSPMRFTKSAVPPAVLARLDTLRGQIVTGALKPPTSLDELAAFVPPR